MLGLPVLYYNGRGCPCLLYYRVKTRKTGYKSKQKEKEKKERKERTNRGTRRLSSLNMKPH